MTVVEFADEVRERTKDLPVESRERVEEWLAHFCPRCGAELVRSEHRATAICPDCLAHYDEVNDG